LHIIHIEHVEAFLPYIVLRQTTTTSRTVTKTISEAQEQKVPQSGKRASLLIVSLGTEDRGNDGGDDPET
jgi:hypothetical protein